MPRRLFSVFFTGASMFPLLRRGDVLECARTDPGSVRTGDIVVFRRAGAGHGNMVAHRVAGRSGPLLLTRGDRCPGVDPEPVPWEDVAGIAVRRLRGFTRARLMRGWAGAVQASLSRFCWLVRRSLGAMLLRPASAGAARRMIRRLWRPEIRQIRLQTEHGPELGYVHRGRTVARWFPDAGVFHCRRLYSLVLDPPRDGASE